MPRTHGYTPRGKRCFGVKDWQAQGRINVIGALLGVTLLTASLFECTIDSDIFHAWIGQELLPKLPPGAVIVMDNATFHKRQDTQQAIINAGHTLEFMPPHPIRQTLTQSNTNGLKQKLFEERLAVLLKNCLRYICNNHS